MTADYANIPERLKAMPRWTRWRYEIRERGRITKVPLNAISGAFAKSNSPSTWTNFQNAVDSKYGDGIGLVIGKEIVGLDFDHCRSDTGEIAPWALDLLAPFLRATYAEASISGTGVHVLVEGQLKGGGRNIKYPPGNTDGTKIEAYDESSPRFFVMTGEQLSESSEIASMQSELSALEGRVFGKPPEKQPPVAPRPVTHSLSDEELLRKARCASNGSTFVSLFDHGDVSLYGGDDSAADMALSNLLAFWSGDYQTMDRLFRRSGLMRDKWDSSRRGTSTYGRDTLEKALADCTNTYDPEHRPEHRPEPSMAPTTPPVDESAGWQPAEPAGIDGKSEGLTKAQTLISLAHAEAEFFHTDGGEAFASFTINGHRETWPIKSRAFRDWLVFRFYCSNRGKPPGSQALQDALSVIEAEARIKSPQEIVFLRVAERDQTIYIDLCDDQWRAVEVTAAGWTVINDPPVRFRRTKGMLPLPQPEPDGSLLELRPLINAEDEETFVMIVAVMLAWLHPRGPFPLLILQGEQGSTKSTAARAVRSLIDPSTVPLRMRPDDEEDLTVAANNAWILAYDNLSGIDSSLSDALCQISTGGGCSKRELYSNSEEVLFNFQRPIILNGIDELATRPDLIDRSVIINLPAICPEKRRPEEEIRRELKEVSPRVLGALLSAASMALSNIGSVRLKSYPRMADFAKLVIAAEPALPWPPGRFMEYYAKNQGAATAVAMESHPVAVACQRLVEKTGSWEGSASQLLRALAPSSRDDNSWPKSPGSLINKLKRCAPLLREVAGINYDTKRSNGRRLISLRQGSAAPVTLFDESDPVSTLSESPEVDDTKGGSAGSAASATFYPTLLPLSLLFLLYGEEKGKIAALAALQELT